jgi:hypothetical protein
MMQTLGASLMSGQALPLEGSYQQRSALLIGVLLLLVAEDAERMTERLVEENAAMRDIFNRAAPHVADPDLRARLEELGKATDLSLRVSPLQAANDSLRGALIELHAHVEEQSDASARRIEAEIWAELAASTERRRLSMAPI